eukprot:6155579-Amphidinium_carterae.1
MVPMVIRTFEVGGGGWGGSRSALTICGSEMHRKPHARPDKLGRRHPFTVPATAAHNFNTIFK